jgi:transcriptional regulator with XRE-family HTH domain
MTTFGTRLHNERKRLGFTQEAFGNLGGVERNAQSEYESDKVFPKADYLMSLAGQQVDVVYLIYGERADFSGSRQVKELITVIAALPPAQQALGFIMLNLLKRSGSTGQTAADADKLWRSARLLEQFLGMDEANQLILEETAQALHRASDK